MLTVTVSPEYQVVIPQSLRDELGIRPGEKLQILGLEDRIELIPWRTPQQMRGFLKGIDTAIERDEDRL